MSRRRPHHEQVGCEGCVASEETSEPGTDREGTIEEEYWGHTAECEPGGD